MRSYRCIYSSYKFDTGTQIHFVNDRVSFAISIAILSHVLSRDPATGPWLTSYISLDNIDSFELIYLLQGLFAISIAKILSHVLSREPATSNIAKFVPTNSLI